MPGPLGGSAVLENKDLLQTISQLGAAFAGFAALVTALTSRGNGRGSIDAIRLHVAVGGALMAVIGGLLPFVFAAHSVAEENVWRVSAIGLLALDYAYFLVYWTWINEMRKTSPAENLSIRMFFWGQEALFQLSLVACIVGFGSGAAFYLTALFALLGQAAASFLGLVTSLTKRFSSDRPAA